MTAKRENVYLSNDGLPYVISPTTVRIMSVRLQCLLTTMSVRLMSGRLTDGLPTTSVSPPL